MKYLPIRLAHLPGGEEIKKAVENFKHYISHSIEADLKYKIGKGYGTVHHFYKF
jgi:hydroxymethylpyrimidine/phosphomethylpyrimidine kinase